MKRAAAVLGSALALISGLASLASSPAAAATRWYQVEVVLFAQGADDAAWSRNDWREEGPPALARNTVELLHDLAAADRPAGSKRRHAFRTLPASSLGLGAVADRLDRSNDYRVLLHVGWHQPGFSDDDAPAVHLGTLRGLALENRFAAASGEEAEGTVRFWRRRFLHVDVDFAFGDVEAWRQRDDAADPNAPPGGEGEVSREAGADSPSRPEAGERLRVVRLTRSLRLRAGRLHYLDHPLFGMLLEVRRLD